MKNFPIGMQTFRDIIEQDYLYVDKTEEIYKFFAEGGKYYFLARPRRFGKSLLVSTFKEIFSGNKKLFAGLWISDKLDWQYHPVIHIDFTGLNFKTPERLEETLGRLMDDMAEPYDLTLDPKRYYNEKFIQLIEKLAKRFNSKVAILIDEYDKPIIDRIEDEKVALGNRDLLREFYAAIKNVDQHIRFAFVTGVSKFSRVSIFSGLNNLRDITLSDTFAALLGYTDEELLHYFGESISELAKKRGLKREDLLENIRGWYNGYSWDGKNFLYNPHSLMMLLKEERFNNYWFESATPTFLIKKMRQYRTPVEELDNYQADQSVFDSFDVDRMNVASLLFQTGYLTIKKIEEMSLTSRAYYLSYPNTEVKESFVKHLLADFSGKFTDEIGKTMFKLHERIEANDIDGFFQLVKSLYASIPYNIFEREKEGYYHTIIYLILTLIGINIEVEVQTAQGRIDAVIHTHNHIYILEFKMGCAEEALKQVKELRYYEKYAASDKPILLIGVGFDAEQRNIGDYTVENAPI